MRLHAGRTGAPHWRQAPSTMHTQKQTSDRNTAWMAKHVKTTTWDGGCWRRAGMTTRYKDVSACNLQNRNCHRASGTVGHWPIIVGQLALETSCSAEIKEDLNGPGDVSASQCHHVFCNLWCALQKVLNAGRHAAGRQRLDAACATSTA
jgi:hypothetical protein